MEGRLDESVGVGTPEQPRPTRPGTGRGGRRRKSVRAEVVPTRAVTPPSSGEEEGYTSSEEDFPTGQLSEAKIAELKTARQRHRAALKDSELHRARDLAEKRLFDRRASVDAAEAEAQALRDIQAADRLLDETIEPQPLLKPGAVPQDVLLQQAPYAPAGTAVGGQTVPYRPPGTAVGGSDGAQLRVRGSVPGPRTPGGEWVEPGAGAVGDIASESESEEEGSLLDASVEGPGLARAQQRLQSQRLQRAQQAVDQRQREFAQEQADDLELQQHFEEGAALDVRYEADFLQQVGQQEALEADAQAAADDAERRRIYEESLETQQRASAALEEQLSALKQRVAGIETGGAAEMAGLSAELGSIQHQTAALAADIAHMPGTTAEQLGSFESIVDALSQRVDELAESVDAGLASLPDEISAIQERLEEYAVRLVSGSSDRLRAELQSLAAEAAEQADALAARVTDVEAAVAETQEQLGRLTHEVQAFVESGTADAEEAAEFRSRVDEQLAAVVAMAEASPQGAASTALTEVISQLQAIQVALTTALEDTLAGQRQAVAQVRALSEQQAQTYTGIRGLTQQAAEMLTQLQQQGANVPTGQLTELASAVQQLQSVSASDRGTLLRLLQRLDRLSAGVEAQTVAAAGVATATGGDGGDPGGGGGMTGEQFDEMNVRLATSLKQAVTEALQTVAAGAPPPGDPDGGGGAAAGELRALGETLRSLTAEIGRLQTAAAGGGGGDEPGGGGVAATVGIPERQLRGLQEGLEQLTAAGTASAQERQGLAKDMADLVRITTQLRDAIAANDVRVDDLLGLQEELIRGRGDESQAMRQQLEAIEHDMAIGRLHLEQEAAAARQALECTAGRVGGSLSTSGCGDRGSHYGPATARPGAGRSPGRPTGSTAGGCTGSTCSGCRGNAAAGRSAAGSRSTTTAAAFAAGTTGTGSAASPGGSQRHGRGSQT